MLSWPKKYEIYLDFNKYGKKEKGLFSFLFTKTVSYTVAQADLPLLPRHWSKKHTPPHPATMALQMITDLLLTKESFLKI